MLTAVDGDALDRAVDAYLTARNTAGTTSGKRQVIAVDGKSLRGSGRLSAGRRHLLAAVTHHRRAAGRPLPGNRNDCKAWELSGAKDAVGNTTVIADGGYRGTGLVIPHRRERG